MAHSYAPTYATANYAAIEMRVGYLLRSLNSGEEVYFQPGDDTISIRESIEALEEVPEPKREVLFDMIASNYF
tara:strand:- start:3 stop:221 length:219 start_codon:yes stop_codon:yes gene_type:complete